MEIGEQQLARPELRNLRRLRLLDLEDQVRLGEHVVGESQHLGALRLVLLVVDRGALSGISLDEHTMAVSDQFLHAGRGQGHPILRRFDLPRYPDLHSRLRSTRISAI